VEQLLLTAKTISNRTFALCQINYLQAHYPSDLRLLDEAQLPQLAQELRNHRRCFCKEGHLGASLGVIELTIALHYVFNTQMIY
jgi:deoxyxylulose-5-phosphate synthase